MTAAEIVHNFPDLDKIFTKRPYYVEQYCKIREFKPESFILRKGDLLDNIYFLLQGTVNVLNEFEEGDSFHFAQVNSFNILGEIEFLAQEKIIAATCMAKTICLTIQIPLKNMEKWICDDNQFFHFIVKALAKKNYEASLNRGIELMYPIKHLLKIYLIKQLKIEGNYSVILGKSRKNISEELGISVRSVNRAVHDLKAKNMISIEKGKIYVSKSQYSEIQKSVAHSK